MLGINETDTNYKVNKEKQNDLPEKMIYFLICEACFWCASCIDVEKMATTINSQCPYCNNARLESAPVSLRKLML
jgi:hypothetical protein